MKGPYDDILGLPRHVSAKHPPMPRRNRAAQFAPFSALAGYGDAIRETARHTEPRRELDPQRQQELDAQLRRLLALGSKKDGGAYRTAMGRVRGVLADRGLLVLEDGTTIPLEQVTELQEESPAL